MPRQLFDQLRSRIRADFVLLRKVLAESFVLEDVQVVFGDKVIKVFGGLRDEVGKFWGEIKG